jgi:tetratricopeptide (TPR) repeat protein/transcriptional regulator with XRE-family HTH domain
MKKPANVVPNLQLKRAREYRGWSQEDVAREVGTVAFTVSRWERGIALPSPYFRQQLSTLFGLSLAELGLIATKVDERPEQAPVQADEAALPHIHTVFPLFDPAIPPPLPQDHSLVGRDELLHRLKQRLLDGGRAALSALNGLPGVGKTALATALAHDEEVRQYFSDGILWVGLGTEPDVLELLSRWGTLLGSVPPDVTHRSRPEAWANSIHAAIGQRRMLLVIDDAWDLTQALAFQVGGPNSAHLITTRFPEIARHFAAEGAIVVRELENTEGRILLMRLAPEVVQAEPEEAQALVVAVGGLPLALTLLGNYLRAQTYSGKPRRLRAALEQLRSIDGRLRLSEPQALIGGHPSLSAGTPLSLQAVIGISDQQVSEEGRATLRALAVFPPKPNTFSEAAAVAVSAMPLETIDELTDAGLLESGGPERYMLHQTIADYARAHAANLEVAERLVTYFVEYVEKHTTDYANLEHEHSNILAALETAFERDMRLALVRGVHGFASFLITRGLYDVAEKQLQRSREAARTLEDAIGQTNAWLHLGEIAEHRGNYALARECWQNGLNLARQSANRNSVAQILRELGGLAWQQGQFAQAHQFLKEALDMLRQLDDSRSIADVLKNLGNLAAEQGQPEQAHRLYEEALNVYRQLGDQRGVAFTLHNLGILAREQGQPEQAQQLYEEALDSLRHLGDRHSTAVVLNNLGNLARHQGQFEQAQQYLNESLAMQRQLGTRGGVAFTLLNLGNLATDEGQFKQAHQLYEEALATFRELQARRNIALVLQSLGTLLRKQGQFEQAHRFLDEAMALFDELQDQRQVALTLREFGVMALQQGQPEQAYQLLMKALDFLRQLQDRREVALTLHELGALARQQGQPDVADQRLTEALGTMRQLRDRRNAAQTLKELGLLAQQRGQMEEALHLLLTAHIGLTLARSPDTSTIEKMLGQMRAQLGENIFNSIVRHVAGETPEMAYGLDQGEWEAAVGKLSKMVHMHQ